MYKGPKCDLKKQKQLDASGVKAFHLTAAVCHFMKGFITVSWVENLYVYIFICIGGLQ